MTRKREGSQPGNTASQYRSEVTMVYHRITTLALLLVGVLVGMVPGALLGPNGASAQVMDDYTAYPAFMSNSVPPNILLLMDNSGSMNGRAYETAFDTTKVYFGLFDPYECYLYASSRFQPNPAVNPTTLGTCGASYPWSGNLVNYVSMRRVDIVKYVMVGGTCAVARNADGSCTRVLGQSSFAACCQDQTQSVTVAQASGRMPASIIPASGSVYFHMMGSVAALKGKFCVDDESTQQTTSDCNDGGTYTETVWQIQVDRPETVTGVIQQVGSRARFGLMEFKGAGDGGNVLADVGASTASLITAVETTVPSTWTPLAESLYEAVRYFAQIAPAYTNTDYSYTDVTRDPYYFTSPQWASSSQYVQCCKSFVIVFTDGEPTQDLNIPAVLQDADHAVHGAHCTGATTADTCAGHKTNYASNGSHYLDDVAYFAHTTDLRQVNPPNLGALGKDLAGTQNLTIYTFYAFGQPIGREILQTTARAGGFEDRNGNNLPDLPEEWDRVNNDTGAALPDGIPDTYFESGDADRLRDRMMAAIGSILQRSASGTAVSVLATSSTGEGALYQAHFYPSTFEGLDEIKWLGYLQGLFLDSFGNLREDTDGDGRLVLQNDNIIKTRLDPNTNEVKVDRYRDNNGDGKADPTIDTNGDSILDTATPFETVGLREVKPIWEAGKQLALTDSSTRKILTWVDSDNDKVVDTGEQIEFTGSNAATLSPYLRAGAAPYTATNLISFIRGDQVSGLRNRQIQVPPGSGTLKVWKLGDVVHSTPTVVGAPKERYDVIYGDPSYGAFYQQYRNRRQVAYVGANDGMLHAFNAGYYHRGDDSSTTSTVEHGWFTRTPIDNSGGPLLSQELWGFIPHELLPQLQWLARGDYTHVYYVDLKPKVTDARIFAADADHPNGWGTILIGGMRLGGSCGSCVVGTGGVPMSVTADFGSGMQTRTFYTAYFALDITNPERGPVLLWSFSTSDLGLSTTYPAVVRVNPSASGKTDNTNAKWLLLVGSGPTSYAGTSSQTAKQFSLDLATGPVNPSTGLSMVTSFPTIDSNAFMGDAISVDLDLDFRVDSLYGGDAYPTGSTPAWAGRLYRLTTGGGSPTLTSWGIASGIERSPTALLATFPQSGTTRVGPVIAPPTVTLDDARNVWLFFGTGRFYSVTDKVNADTQHFFGVKDPVATGVCTQVSVSSCEQPDLVNVSSAVVCTICSGAEVSGVAGVTTLLGSATTTLQGLIQTKHGWYTTLPTAGERAVVSPTLLGGIVFFPTFVPSADICTASGSGYLYALFYLTGSAYKDPVIGTQAAGADMLASRGISLGNTGLASQMAVHIGGQGSGASGAGNGSGCVGSVTGFIQSSTGTLSQFCTKPALSVWSRYLSWLQQEA